MKSTISSVDARKVAILILPAVAVCVSGCDLGSPTERRDMRPSDCPWLIGAPEFPDLSQAERIDIASQNTIDSNHTWIKAKMKPTYGISDLEKDAQRMTKGKYRNYRTLTVKNLKPVAPIPKEKPRVKTAYQGLGPVGVLIGTPRDWPSVSSDTPKWWLPPSECPNGVVFLWERQVSVEGPKKANRAAGLYVLYSPKRQTIWVWRWNEQHVRLSKFRGGDRRRGKFARQ